jgi:integrase
MRLLMTLAGGHHHLVDFRAAERRRGLAETSIDKRLAIAQRWSTFIGEPFDPAVTWRDVDAFIDGSKMKSSKSRYAAISHLHQFYLWAMRCDLVDRDPTALVVRPRVPAGLPRPAHDTDLALALTVATGPLRTAIVLAASCGLRCVELSRLRWCDVGIDSIRVTGKGGKERVLPLPELARDALDALDRADDYVLPWREARDISPGRRVSHVINRFFDDIGCDTTAHQLRHWCATNAIKTCNLADVQDYLGHASPATTRIYVKLDPERLRIVAASIILPIGDLVAA